MPSAIGDLQSIASAAIDRSPIRGLTHTFYRYPARFSPLFARAAIEAYSMPGDIVLDPFMGGGTTVIEAMVLGRQAIGADINELSIFLARAKVTTLSADEKHAVRRWANTVVQNLRCSARSRFDRLDLQGAPQNLSMPAARWLRKTITQCILTIEQELPSAEARRFARCVLLNAGQWALNGRRRIPRAAEFRDQVSALTSEMLSGATELQETLGRIGHQFVQPLICHCDAEKLDQTSLINDVGPVDLVVTSPPYPGIHMLYHRWQVDGRKETDAPYWIAACHDGAGASYYNFADRRPYAENLYFEKAERSFSAVRRVMRNNGTLVQMIAFAEPERQLKRYLSMMERSGFIEERTRHQRRIWRDVPGRRWHANLKGELPSSKEVVLVHRAA